MREGSLIKSRVLASVLVPIAFLMLLGCGEGTTVIFASFNGSTNQGSDSSEGGTSERSSGLVVVAITDAEPLLPSGTEQVWLEVQGIFIHREGGEWFSLPLIRTPFILDLLNYQSGKTIDLIQPLSLESGTYDRIRLVADNAYVVSNGNTYPVTITPGNTTIEKDFLFDLNVGGFLDLTVDFDLSQSLRSPLEHSYELTPVLHINHTDESAVISGEIADTTFDSLNATEAAVTIYRDNDLSGSLTASDEEYTRIRINRDSPKFSIFWLTPEEGYTASVEIDGREPADFEEFVYPADLQKGGVLKLNYGIPL